MWNILRFVISNKWQKNKKKISFIFCIFLLLEIIEKQIDQSNDVQDNWIWVMWTVFCVLDLVSINFDMKVTFTTNLIVNGQLHELLHPQSTIPPIFMPHSVHYTIQYTTALCMNWILYRKIAWASLSSECSIVLQNALHTKYKSFEYISISIDLVLYSVHWKLENERIKKIEKKKYI